MHLFVGGTRSGKSALAQQWVEGHASGGNARLLYVATCRVEDDEMAARVALHRQKRGPSWTVCEEALDPLGAVSKCLAAPPDTPQDRPCAILLDCISLWVANLLAAGLDSEAIAARVQTLAQGLASCGLPCALVSAEVGMGLVPTSALGRQYRDILGETNQILAAVCDSVVFVTCGLPLVIKGKL